MAKRDLEDIEAWIADHDGETRASAVMQRLRKSMDNLSFMPGLGGRRRYLRRDQRAFSVPPWTIFYKQFPDGIEVVRIIHGRRDLSEIFKQP